MAARNSSGDAATNAEIDLQLPPGALFVDASGAAVSVDLSARTVSWTGALDAGSTHTIAVRLIVPRASRLTSASCLENR